MTVMGLGRTRAARRGQRGSARRPHASRWSTLGWGAIGIIAFLVAWEYIALQVRDIAVLPAPFDVLENIRANYAGSPALEYLGLSRTSYLGNLEYTGSAVLTAWLTGSAVGVVTGVAASRIQPIRDVVDPILYVFGVVPVLVAAPFFLIWFGFGFRGQWILDAFYCLVMATGAALVAASTAPPRFEEYAAALGVGRAGRLRSVVLPQTVPSIVGALRVALGGAWGLQVTAELMGSPAGIGRIISVRAKNSDVSSVLAVIFIVGIVALACDVLLATIARRSLRWQ